jgi:hypothetical protein
VREYARGAVAGAVGAVVTFALAAAGPVPPTGAVAGGALVAAALHWVTAERREFRTAGTTYALGAAALLALLATVPPVYRWSLVPSLAVFGLASALVTAVFVVVRVGARAVARRYVPEALAAASALAVVWTVLQVQERLARTGVTATLGTAALAADWYGLALPVEATLLGAAVDLPTVVFVGSVVVGFHTLASWEAAWRVAEESNARWRAGESSGAGDERGA